MGNRPMKGYTAQGGNLHRTKGICYPEAMAGKPSWAGMKGELPRYPDVQRLGKEAMENLLQNTP